MNKQPINLNSAEEFKKQLRELILKSNHTTIVAVKMKEAASGK